MHLLAAQPGEIADGSAAIDLGQTPGNIVYITAADSEISLLANTHRGIPNAPSLRLANLMALGHNYSVDLYVEKIVANAKIVILRLLGGRGYWPYGLGEIVACCRAKRIRLACLPGDDAPDADLMADSTIPAEAVHRLWRYMAEGGPENAANLLRYAADLGVRQTDWQEPKPLLRAGVYWPGGKERPSSGRPVAAILFYRALLQAGNLAAVDGLIAALDAAGLDALPIYAASLREPQAAAIVDEIMAGAPPDVILNATGFSRAAPGESYAPAQDVPELQVVFSGGTEIAWLDGTRGLSPRDIAMNVALPEVDGRLITRAVSFKSASLRDEPTQADIVSYAPIPDRLRFVAQLAAAWARLRRKPASERRVALVLANYPNRDGRIGNGVGLDTPASAVVILKALQDAGYETRDLPADGAELVARVLAGQTNDHRRRGLESESLSLADYQLFFAALPKAVRDAVTARWGAPERDPFYRAGETDCGRFAIAAFRCGAIAIGLQPARGYNIDPSASYHDPALVPPHGYLAFYAWMREQFRADAIVHLGKHGNLEWLPGKALALSQDCLPEAALGPLPHLYPFIVNDPGEGTQAKRRAAACIVDHLTPPLTRAESYGPLRDLERLVDEYFEASGVDPRRCKLLSKEILDLARKHGIAADCGIVKDTDETDALAKLDGYLCELKELQIRDGLHIFGVSPTGDQLTDLLVALARVPQTGDANSSLLRALADDLALDIDPLNCDMAAPWAGLRPAALTHDAPWRSTGDTVERLEMLARKLVSGGACEPAWLRTQLALTHVEQRLRPAVAACGEAEMAGLLKGLAGRFVSPGPSGAPTRGRPDVLPTGRNFYSVDTRAVPTPAAWTLGWKSATLLIERHAQEQGEYPRAVALSAWGTANMRTGGDDIAQGLALMGVRPTWDSASRRVTGFEILPLSVLGRPRVDVTLRVSGFFRDAFPGLIDLFDSAARAIAALDEPAADNPLAARAHEERTALIASGASEQDAERRSTYRVFGSKPGAYGAGLQALIDERGWTEAADLARAYVAWSGYAYGAGAEGKAAHESFGARLSLVEAVLHNQDNREHDLLDSDDYYQFEGGITAAVTEARGAAPEVYHNDHSRPESPRIRTLREEIGRVVRARAVNPKWLKGVMRHGYKGAFEMAATVDYLFAFAATTNAVADHHFDAVYDAYIADPEVRAFVAEANPAALKEMSARLLEAQERGLWKPTSNHAAHDLAKLSGQKVSP
ncbi:MAG TPA: cobaltochelatase subunit CobN [Alphaproteobacteria bacterium]|nr:cobaltochelatase subunit CobN [Alphaproteobacteria bacterium]